MPPKVKRRYLIPITLLVSALIFLSVYFMKETWADETTENTQTNVAVGREDRYSNYLQKYSNMSSPIAEIEVDIFDLHNSQEVEIKDNYEGESKVLISNEEGFVEWLVTVEEEGMYNIYLEYFPSESKGVEIERSISLNGEVPFLGADSVAFSRVWADKEEVKKDNRGNDVRPSQVEKPRWSSSYVKDYMGYYTEPYKFYFKKGDNILRFDAINEPLVLSRLLVKNMEELESYDEYISGIDQSKYQNSDMGYMNVKQGEDAEFRSSPTLYASFDRSSSNTEPYSSSKITLNMIGGIQWRVAGQWIEWEVDVPEDGMYSISIKGRQNYNRGFVSNRVLYIDDVIPFEEASVIPFTYSNKWGLNTLSDNQGNEYLFPLTKGTHTIKLEITLGELGELLDIAENCVYQLNSMYRKILIVTGTTPDKYRDYQIDKIYPEVMEAMKVQSAILEDLVDKLTKYSGQKGSQVAAAQIIAKQLQRFIEKPDVIPSTLENFKANIGSLGASILTLREAPLDIDYILIAAPDAKLPKVKESFIDKSVHEVRSFLSSFFEDYNSIGSVYDEGESVDVWVLSGRDQSQVLKAMIDDDFTPKTGISVNVKLITPETLLPSVVAGTGPDVAVNVQFTEPINYALRNAAVDLSKLDGFDKIATQYYDSALESYRYRGGIYGLPETQIYPMLFYRKDILEEMNLEVPRTWTDLVKALPVIQKNNMNFGLSSVDVSSLLAMIYQRGGTLYLDGGVSTALDTAIGVDAFEFYTTLFNHYKLPLVYDFVNRFRTGEMPMGIDNYSVFNTLSVFAPEIKGLWGMAPLPGIEDENGNINHASSSWGACSMILSDAKDLDKSWEFLQWWEDSTTQSRYGREMESLMGAAARYGTANKITFDELSWNSENSKNLKEQWNMVRGTPEVPGGYFVTRHLLNAFRKVVNDKDDPRETLLDYSITIDEELLKKRKEFGLPIE